MSEQPPKNDLATPMAFIVGCCATALAMIAYMLLKSEGLVP